MQVEVVTGQDARELEADVADAEDGHGGDDRQRLEQHRDLAAAALHAVLQGCLVGEVALERLRPGAAGLHQGPRAAYRLRLEVAAADRPGGRGRADDHLGAGLAGGVTAHVGQRDQDAGLAGTAEVGHRLPPGGHRRTADRARSSAQYTASGVAGEASSTEVPSGPNAAHAARSASRTENASISGGSPTALEP